MDAKSVLPEVKMSIRPVWVIECYDCGRKVILGEGLHNDNEIEKALKSHQFKTKDRSILPKYEPDDDGVLNASCINCFFAVKEKRLTEGN